MVDDENNTAGLVAVPVDAIFVRTHQQQFGVGVRARAATRTIQPIQTTGAVAGGVPAVDPFESHPHLAAVRRIARVPVQAYTTVAMAVVHGDVGKVATSRHGGVLFVIVKEI